MIYMKIAELRDFTKVKKSLNENLPRSTKGGLEGLLPGLEKLALDSVNLVRFSKVG